MPEQLAVATVNTLQDDLVALFADERTVRELVIDPHLMHSDAGPWTDDVDVARIFPEASGSAQAIVGALELAEGDRVVELELEAWQESGTTWAIAAYSVDSTGARTIRGAAATTAVPGWNTLAIVPGYTLAADETFVLLGISGVAGDKFGGGIGKVDHP